MTNTITGTAGDDTLTGTVGTDVIDGLGGNDQIAGGDGADTLNGGDGNDYLNGGLGSDTLNGGDGNDNLQDYSGANIFDGGAGDDFIATNGSAAGQQVSAGDGNDQVQIYSTAQATVSLGSGSDRIELGYASGAHVDGGADADTFIVYGSTGAALTGGLGSDTFRLVPGQQVTITDFAAGPGGDVLDIPVLLQNLPNYPGGNPFASGFVKLVQQGADTLLMIDHDGAAVSTNTPQLLATLQSVNAANITSDNLAGYAPSFQLDNLPTGAVTITGTAEIGETLTASNTLADADGLGAISYQWLRGGVAVGSGAAYVLTAADVGHAMTVVARYTDGLGVAESVASAATAPVSDGNDAPDGLALSGGSVAENAADGTQVGTLQGQDPDSGDTLSYSLLDDAGGRFAVDAVTGVISVANSALLDYETAPSYQIAARVTDASGAHFDRSFTIAITNVAETQVINGTAAADILTATSDDNWTVTGLGGNDTITTLGGADTIRAGVGDDVIATGAGDDTILRSGSEGYDQVDGGSGFDTIKALANNTVIGLKSAIDIEAVTANGFTGVRILGSSGNDALDFSGATLTGIATIDGGAGNDMIIGSASHDTIIGGSGNDSLSGGDGNDLFRFSGSSGADTIDGGAGVDTIEAFVANSTLNWGGYTGIEVITGRGFANVKILGTASADTMDFSQIVLSGIAMIDGGAGNDAITGSAGADTIVGGAGNDSLSGGGGNDLFRFSGSSGVDMIDGGDGFDTIEASAANATLNWGGLTGIEAISGGGFANVRILGSAGADTMDFSQITLGGIALIDGGAGNDTITGSAGADTIIGGAGNDGLSGGEGNDLFLFSANSGVDTIDGGDGFDTIEASAANATLNWNGLADIEAISSGGFANVRILGTSGADTMDFSQIALNGVAKIVGGFGADTMTASGGADVFSYVTFGESKAGSADTIHDFQDVT